MSKTEEHAARPARRKPARRRLGGLIAWGLLTLAAVAVVALALRIGAERESLAARRAEALGRQSPPVNVVVLTLQPTRVRDRLELPATVAPWTTLAAAAEVPGRVVRKFVAEGEAVAAGAPLVALDARDYRSRHQAAKADYETARADLLRLEKLVTRKASTEAKLDEARSRLAAAKAALEQTALELERTTVRAAIGGVVNRLPVEIGQYLRKGDPVAELLEVERLKVVVGIPESDVAAVRRLETFEVSIDALGGRRFPARRHYLSRRTDAAARLYELQLALDNPGGEILPDMFARVEIVKAEVDDALAVPLYAVISRQDGQVVYVVEDGVARARPVTIGMIDGWRCQVLRGLSAGEQVIVMGQRSVNDGQAVAVVDRLEETGGAGG